jgi:hypothetical protein
MTTDTADRTFPIALPTEAALKALEEKLRDANEALGDVTWPVYMIAKAWGDGSGGRELHPGDEVPTFEALGRLFSYGSTFRSYLDSMNEYASRLEDESLRSLDIVRDERGARDA